MGGGQGQQFDPVWVHELYFPIMDRNKQMMDYIFHLIEYHSKNILQRFCSNVMKQTHLTGCRHWSTKTFLFNIKHSNKMKIFNEHTLITIIGPTALISYARSKDDFSTLVNVVSVLQIEEYD